MGGYRIVSFEGRPDVICANGTELLPSLFQLVQAVWNAQHSLTFIPAMIEVQ